MAVAHQPGKPPQTTEAEPQPGKTAHAPQIHTPTAAAQPTVPETAHRPGKPPVARRPPTLASAQVAQVAPMPLPPALRRLHTEAATHGVPKLPPT